MRTLYNIATYGACTIVWIAQFFNKKMLLFNRGRKETFCILSEKLSNKDHTVWFHCASLGEYEQGVPIMKAIKKQFPQYKLLVSFFSPSGYENKKNSTLADAVVYLPMDTLKNARRFVSYIQPVLAVFVRYEFWPNYLFELQRQQTPTLLVSGLFNKDQVFFKSYGKFMRKTLSCFNHIFVQEEASKKLLNQISINNVTISGDTRFDRVSMQTESDNTLDFVTAFKDNTTCIVCGSTWPEDEAILTSYLNNAPHTVKFIIAPHKIDHLKIEAFRKRIKKSSICYSEKEGQDISEFQVLIIDTIGLLAKIYSSADIAYVGGAMGTTGLHNILEPATFGIPIIIGKNFKRFPEAIYLHNKLGLYSVSTPEECSQIFHKLATNLSFRKQTGAISSHFINSHKGATQITMSHINTLLLQ